MSAPAKVNDQYPDPRTFIDIPIRDLLIDAAVQRALRSDHAEQLANEWDWNKAEVPTVTRRGNVFAVIEGQTRIAAQNKRFGIGIFVHCAVITVGSVLEEAEIGLAISKGRRRHSALEVWQQNVKSGKPRQCAAQQVITAHGLRLGASCSSLTIAAVGAVNAITGHPRTSAKESAERLDRILSILRNAYPENDEVNASSRWHGLILRAADLLLSLNPTLNDARLSKKIRGRQADQWLQLAGPSGLSPTQCLVYALADAYNRRLPGDSNRRLRWN